MDQSSKVARASLYRRASQMLNVLFRILQHLSIINILPNRVADIYIKLISITLKLHTVIR